TDRRGRAAPAARPGGRRRSRRARHPRGPARRLGRPRGVPAGRRHRGHLRPAARRREPARGRPMKSWLTALRIARREARRAKGRSALVVAMIALPVLCLSFAAVTYDMFTRTPAERITRELGAADARVFWISDGQAMQDFEGSGFASRGQPKGPYTEAELLAALPPGSRIIADLEGEVDMRTAAGTGILPARGLDVADPLVAGRVTLLAGRAPASGDEVALTEQA